MTIKLTNGWYFICWGGYTYINLSLGVYADIYHFDTLDQRNLPGYISDISLTTGLPWQRAGLFICYTYYVTIRLRAR